MASETGDEKLAGKRPWRLAEPPNSQESSDDDNGMRSSIVSSSSYAEPGTSVTPLVAETKKARIMYATPVSKMSQKVLGESTGESNAEESGEDCFGMESLGPDSCEIKQYIIEDKKLHELGDQKVSNQPISILVTRKYPVMAMVKIRQQKGEPTEVLMSLDKYESIKEEDELIETKRAALHRSDEAYISSILKPFPRYSVDFLNHSTDFKSRTVLDEVIACMFYEKEEITTPILNRIPDDIRVKVQAEFEEMKRCLDVAPKMSVEKKITQLQRIMCVRFVTLAKGVPLDPDLKVIDTTEAEILIYDETTLEENVLYRFNFFSFETVREMPVKKVKCTSTPHYVISPLKTFGDEFKKTVRVTDTIETIENYRNSTPIHGEIDLIAILDSIEPVDQDSARNEYFVHLRSVEDNRKKIRMFGSPKEHGLGSSALSSASTLYIRNLKIIPKKLALLTSEWTEFQCVPRFQYTNLLAINKANMSNKSADSK